MTDGFLKNLEADLRLLDHFVFHQGEKMNKTIYRIISFIVSITLLLGGYSIVNALSASTQSYYVSPSGSDTNPGSLTLPFNTITKAMNTAVAGDIIYVRGGTYPGFAVTKNNLTIAGYNNEMPLISGGAGIKISGASYVAIKGFEVVGATGNWTGAITSASGNYNLIQGNKVHDNTQNGMAGILVEDGSYNQVLYNDVYNNNFVGIRIYGTAASVMNGNEIGFNVSHDQTLSGGNSDGIDIDAPISTGAYIHDNIVYGNADDGIDTWNSSNNLIVRNIAYNQNGIGDGNGFKVGGWTGSVAGGNNTLIGNVSYNNKTAGFTTNGGYGSKYYNNVAYNNGSYGFDDGWRSFSCSVTTCPSAYINNVGYNNAQGNFAAYLYTAISHNNIWYSDNGSANVSYNYVGYTSLASFFAAKGLDNPSGNLASLQVNPQFVNPAGGSFQLLSSSPAIDHGDPANPGQITAINRVDMGAFEFAGSPITNTPTPGASPTLPIFTSTPISATASPTATHAPVLATFTSTPIMPTTTQTASSVPASPTYTPTSVQPILTSTASPAPILPTMTTTFIPSPTPQATVQSPLETIYDDANSIFVYSSGWSRITSGKAYDGSYMETNTKNSSATLTFTGQAFSILYTAGPSFGRVDVYLDGALAGSINEKSASLRYQQRWNAPGTLSSGSHILKLAFVGARRTKGTLDAVIVR